jgi:lipoprotein-releasing system permease protein
MRRRLARFVLGILAVAAAAGAVARPERRNAFGGAALAIVLLLGLVEFFALDVERFVGLRYLHRARPARGARTTLAVSIISFAFGLGLFFASRGRWRTGETIGVSWALSSGLVVEVAFLMNVFSVFTTVSTTGVILGVKSLVVVLAVTSGFEREFQDKVLALNAHLIVIPYGDVDIDSPEADRIEDKLRGMPGVVKMSKFLFSAGEVMVGRIGANLKGVDLKDGVDDLRRALIEGRVEDLAAPASCPLPEGSARRETSDVGRIALGVELAHKLHLKVGQCVSIMVPFSADGAPTPPAFLFKVVGLFRMGFNEYDTRLAYVSLADARRIANARGSVFGVEMRFADPLVALRMTPEVKRRLDAPYRVIDWKELNHNLFMALTMQKVMISLLLGLIIAVAAFNIIASLTMIVLSKVREIAILKAMGARSATVARIFILGGSTVGAIGTSLGILYGLLVCLLDKLYGYPLDPKVYLIEQLPVQISLAEILLVAAGTLGICFLATLYPAWRASRMRPVDGLRYD